MLNVKSLNMKILCNNPVQLCKKPASVFAPAGMRELYQIKILILKNQKNV